MAFDVNAARKRLNELSSCLADAQQIRRELTTYRTSLNSAWTGKEMAYFNSVIDSLTTTISALEGKIGTLQRNISLAIREIQEEEAAAAKAAAAAAAALASARE